MPVMAQARVHAMGLIPAHPCPLMSSPTPSPGSRRMSVQGMGGDVVRPLLTGDLLTHGEEVRPE
jgi:hypothetical protein